MTIQPWRRAPSDRQIERHFRPAAWVSSTTSTASTSAGGCRNRARKVQGVLIGGGRRGYTHTRNHLVRVEFLRRRQTGSEREKEQQEHSHDRMLGHR